MPRPGSKKSYPTLFRTLTGAVILACVPPPVVGQTYPNRPIRLIAPVAPGGGPDVVARFLAPKVSELLGQPVIVENRAGANAMIGADVVAKSAPDGYTWLIATAQNTVNPALVKKMPHDIVNDFTPVTLLLKVPFLLLIHPSIPAKSVKDLIALARVQPGKLNFGSGGTGSAAYLSAELMKVMARIQMVHVSYKGVGLALTDLLGGHLDLMFPSIPSGLPYHKAGTLRGLGVTSPQRHPSIPELPTIAEAALPGYESRSWYGVLVPSRTSREVVNRINSVLRQLVALPEVRNRMIALGSNPETGTPEEFAAFIREDMVRAARVVQAAGVKAE